MKKTIAQIVAENKDRALACGTTQELFLLGRELGFDSRAAFPRYKTALKSVCGIDYDAVKAARIESQTAAIAAAANFEITLYTDFKMKTDKFAICDGRRNVIGYGKTFEELEQSQGELWTALKALDIAASAKRNAKLEAVRLNLFVDAQWLTSLSGKAQILADTARRFGIELNIQWISGTTNPADQWTTAGGYEKIDWTATQDLLNEIGKEQNETQPAEQPAVVIESQTVTATTPAVQPVAQERSNRGHEFEAWFAAHATEWPTIRDAWKAEGLTSKQRDERLVATVKAWASENCKS